MNKHFGFTNIYLKVGLVFLVVSILILIAAFVARSATGYFSGRVAGYFFVAGTVLYVIGRIAQIRQSRAQSQ